MMSDIKTNFLSSCSAQQGLQLCNSIFFDLRSFVYLNLCLQDFIESMPKESICSIVISERVMVVKDLQ